MPDPLDILQSLIRCPSVTPAEAGALAYLESILTPAGFDCRRLRFAEPGLPEVDNLFAQFGTGARISALPDMLTWCRRATRRCGATRRLRPRSKGAWSMAAAPAT
jgi:hypothetical protein